MVINAECGKTVRIAYQGENKRQQVRFDLADIMGEFPGGTAVLAILRSGDTDPVPAAEVELDTDGKALVWTVTAWECAVEGFVYAQVTYVVDDVVAKTRIWRFDVKNSLVVSAAEPEGWADLVGQLVTAAAGVNTAIEAAQEQLRQYVADAEAAESAAAQSATAAGTAQAAAETAQRAAEEAVGQYDDMTATATGLAAGSAPTAEIDHTGSAPVLRLGIPAGERGADGAQGPQGERGPAGPAGPKGDPGEAADVIDDTAASTSKTYSSSKLETQREELLSAINGKFGIQNVGRGLNVSEDVSTGSSRITLNADVQRSDITNLQQNKADIIITSASGSIASISDGADDLPIEDMVVQIEPVQSGSGDPSPDNVRPISGWTGANVYRTGKNLFNKSVALGSGYYAPTTGIIQQQADSWHTDFIPVKGGSTVYANKVSATNTGGTTSTFFASWVFWDKDKTYVSGKWNASATSTVPDNACYLTLSISNTFSASTIETFLADYMLAYGTSAQAYEPYQGETYPITWQSAGTVYGGTVNPVTGKLIVDRAIITADGTNVKCNASYGNSGPNWLPAINISANKSKSPWTIIADKLQGLTSGFVATDNSIGIGNSGAVIAVHIAGIQGTDGTHGYNSASECQAAANAWLAQNPTQICYLLETPVEYDLTPTEIRTLLGVNNIWADTGDVSVDYRADTKLYIQQLTKPTEDDMTANTAITSGKFFMVGNRLFRATAAIAVGATIIPGTNCTELSLADALNNING